MKKAILFAVICLASLPGFTQNEKTAPMTDVVRHIAQCWQQANAGSTDNIHLKSVKASFTVSKTTSSGGELKIWIFKLGRKKEKKQVSSVILELSEGDKRLRDAAPDRRNDPLTQFIQAAIADFRKLNAENLLASLPKRELTIEVGITITRSKIIAGEYEIGIFSLSGEAGKNTEQGHTLTLVIGN